MKPALRFAVSPVLRFALAAQVLGACSPPYGSYRYDPAQATHPQFSEDRAYQHVAAQVAFGPRPPGSQALRKTADYLEQQLKQSGWAVQRQEFQDHTPLGQTQFCNLRARFPRTASPQPDAQLWQRPVTVLIGSHYDTKYFRDVIFTGANDGGSSTGILLEMARVLAAQPALAGLLELVFFDGEEAFETFTDTDGLYGSRHYVKTMKQAPGKHSWPKAVVILDLLGEKALNVQIPSDTPAHLRSALFAAARDLGHSHQFGVSRNPITDDHSPFQREGIPAIDIIDLDYGAWHTSRDTMNQISKESLGICGKTALLLVEKYLTAP